MQQHTGRTGHAVTGHAGHSYTRDAAWTYVGHHRALRAAGGRLEGLWIDPDDRTGRCGDDRRVILPPLPRQGSRIPSYAGARIRGIRLGPLRWEQKGRTSHSPDYSVLGRTLGQVTHGPPGPSIRPENALGWDMVSVGGRMGPRSKRAASACPTGQHPNLRLRGSWLRHGGWATPCCRRPEMSRDPDPLRTCG